MNTPTSNLAQLRGTIVSNPEFNHKVFGEGFYKFSLSVPRKSGTADIIPVIISERSYIDLKNSMIGEFVYVTG